MKSANYSNQFLDFLVCVLLDVLSEVFWSISDLSTLFWRQSRFLCLHSGSVLWPSHFYVAVLTIIWDDERRRPLPSIHDSNKTNLQYLNSLEQKSAPRIKRQTLRLWFIGYLCALASYVQHTSAACIFPYLMSVICSFDLI